MSWCVVVCTSLIVAATACGGSDGSGGSRIDTPSPSSPTAATAIVRSSIPDGAHLRKALPWTAEVQVADGDVVDSVDFLVDGKVRWTEQTPPFSFNDDGQVLAPWLLGAGRHVLAVRASSLNGATARASSRVTVAAVDPKYAELAGVYHRRVTSADAQRTKPYRTASTGAFGDPPELAGWTLRVTRRGALITNPDHAGMPFVEPFTLSGDHMTMYGPAVWAQADPHAPNLFCEPEHASSYHWSLNGARLSIQSLEKVCADRDMALVGTWVRAG
jgi:hypothetical protein